MEASGWVAVRCVFRLQSAIGQVYEERVTLWRDPSMDTAIERAEQEALEYADIVDATYTGLAQAYLLSDDVTDGAEVFSLCRVSELEPETYLDRFFDTGDERQLHHEGSSEQRDQRP